MKNKIHIGTSGWSYDHWVGPFYPSDMQSEEFFDFYQEKFNTVEINNTFYQLPKKETLKEWRKQASKNFTFSIKASRYITHMKKLKDPTQSTLKFFNAIEVLEENLGPILFQLPPNWSANPERLKSFIKGLPSGFKYTFELRNESWFTEKIKETLKENNCALCIYDFDKRQSPEWVTADFVYIRLHGPEEKYEGSYSEETLGEWGEKLKKWKKQGKEVFLYFDNDQEGYAPKNAITLKEKIKRKNY